MKEILQEYGGFVLSIVLIVALIASLKTGFIANINSNIDKQITTITDLGNN